MKQGRSGRCPACYRLCPAFDEEQEVTCDVPGTNDLLAGLAVHGPQCLQKVRGKKTVQRKLTHVILMSTHESLPGSPFAPMGHMSYRMP